MALILAYRNRGLTRDLIIKDGNGVVIVPGTNDRLRIIIGHESKLNDAIDLSGAELQFTSLAATTNGSSIVLSTALPGENRMRLDASDLTFPAGVYTLIFDHFDNADAQEWKTISRQVFILEET